MKLVTKLQKAFGGDPAKTNNNINSNGDDDDDDHNNWFRKNLPSEQDRKATLGCLAAVLNIMFEHQLAPKTTSGKLKKGSSSSFSEKGAATSTRSSLGRGSGDACDAVWNGAAARRTREFQKELLRMMSAELLYLDPDVYAIEFLPILNNCDGKFQIVHEDDTDSTGTKAVSSTEKILLNPFLSSFSNAEAGFRCVSLLLFRFLLLSHDNVNDGKDHSKDCDTTEKSKTLPKQPKTIVGYDSRVRYAFKYLSVSVLKFWDPIYGTSASTLYTSGKAGKKYATRKFEALEDAITYRISTISKQIIMESAKQKREQEISQSSSSSSSTTVTPKAIKKRNQIVRGMKIGSAAIGAGALMAITGGIALPAIVGGIAAAAGVTAMSFGAVAGISLLLLPATLTIFGVGSGMLVASKMNNRTRGLTQFDIQPAVGPGCSTTADNKGKKNKKGNHAAKKEQQRNLKLSRTICINGWIADEHDFERPFGMQPHSLADKSELLKRFCSIFAPQVMPNCHDILEEWKNKENELWSMLRDAYGRDPSSLYPLDNNNDDDGIITVNENKDINMMVGSIMGIEPTMMQRIEEEMESHDKDNRNNRPLTSVCLLNDVLSNMNKSNKSNKSNKQLKRSDDGLKSDGDRDIRDDRKYRSYEVWDFQSTYKGMELYTISWEKDLLLQLRGSAKDLQKDLAMKGVEQAMKKTVFATLLSAVAIPVTMLGLADLIDEKWTLANERADEAGILLAESLLTSTAGHRPINLIGISFGSRMIISCLTELSRHQKEWEKQQQRKREIQHGSSSSKSGASNLLKVGDEIRKNVTNVASKLGSIGNNNRDKGGNKSITTSYLREPASIVENIILMGCPATVKPSTWKAIRSVAAGRLINCYSGNDLMLSLMYRMKNPTTALLNPPVGISEVRECGVANFDVSDLINSNHSEYGLVVRDILELVGFDQPGA